MISVVSRYRIVGCTLFKVVEVDGYTCKAFHPTSPLPSKILSEYFGRLTLPVMNGSKRRARGAAQTFPGLDASAMY